MLVKTVSLDYDTHIVMPVGSVVADAAGYWAREGRHYVKTTRNTWAVFFKPPTREQINESVAKKSNNLTPGPTGLYLVMSDEEVSS